MTTFNRPLLFSVQQVAGERSTVTNGRSLLHSYIHAGDSVCTIVWGFFAYKKILGRTETRIRDRMYCQTIRLIRDIYRDDRARIATCTLRTLTDRNRENYSIDSLWLATHRVVLNNYGLDKVKHSSFTVMQGFMGGNSVKIMLWNVLKVISILSDAPKRSDLAEGAWSEEERQILRQKAKKVCFYIAQYPVRWTTQRALHFLPSLADLFIPTPTSQAARLNHSYFHHCL